MSSWELRATWCAQSAAAIVGVTTRADGSRRNLDTMRNCNSFMSPTFVGLLGNTHTSRCSPSTIHTRLDLQRRPREQTAPPALGTQTIHHPHSRAVHDLWSTFTVTQRVGSPAARISDASRVATPSALSSESTLTTSSTWTGPMESIRDSNPSRAEQSPPRRFLLIVSFVATGCYGAPSARDARPAPLTELIAHPAKYSGEVVEVSGFLLISWEGGGIFRTPSEESSYDTEHAVRLRVPNKKPGPSEQYDGTFGALNGVFVSDQSLGWTGTTTVSEIRPVFRFRPVDTPQQAPEGTDAEKRLREEVFRSMRDAALKGGSPP